MNHSGQMSDIDDNAIIPIDVHPLAYFLMKKLAKSNRVATLELIDRINNARKEYHSDTISIGDYRFDVTFEDSMGDCAGKYVRRTWMIDEASVAIRNVPGTLFSSQEKKLETGGLLFSEIIDFSGYEGGKIIAMTQGNGLNVYKYKNDQSQNLEWDKIQRKIRDMTAITMS